MRQSVSYEYRDGPSWILRVMARLNASSSPELHIDPVAWKSQGFPDRAIALQTKLRLVELLVAEADAIDPRLRDQWPPAEELVESAVAGRAVRLASTELAYELISRLSGILYELQSAREILFSFLTKFYRKVIRHAGAGEKEVRGYLLCAELPMRWIDELAELRNRFLHETAPWLGIALEDGEPTEHALLLESYPKDPAAERLLCHSEILGLATDFGLFLGQLELHLVGCIETYEAVQRAELGPA